MPECEAPGFGKDAPLVSRTMSAARAQESPTSTSVTSASSASSAEAGADGDRLELQRLRAEVERLRALVGPSEESYVKLRTDLLGARDAAIGATAEVGALKGRCHALEAQVARLTRDHIWFRDNVVRRLKAVQVWTSPRSAAKKILGR